MRARRVRAASAWLAVLGVVGCQDGSSAENPVPATAWEDFLGASSRCEAATATHDITVPVYGLWRTTTLHVAIEGRRDGRCVVRFRPGEVEVTPSEAARQAMIDKGRSRAEIEEHAAEVARGHRARLRGKQGTCVFPARRTRAYLTYWAQGYAPLERREECSGPLFDELEKQASAR